VTFIDLCLVVLAVSFALTLIRIAIGPSPADRGLAADVGYLVLVAAIALQIMRDGTDVFADIVFVATVVGFLAMLAFAWFVDRRQP
jgi:multicomponent Na+:H+ antiporter subunit F